MPALHENFLAGTITDNPLTNVGTSINSASFANLPTVTAPNVLWLVLDPTSVGGAPELVQVTAHTASATVVTVVRGRQGSVARQHASATIWRHVATADEFDDLPSNLLTTQGDIIYASADGVAARLAKGAAGLPLVAGASVPSYTQVSTSGIADNAITQAKMADASVGTAELTDNAVTNAKIGTGAVDLDELAAAVVARLVPAGTIRMTLAASADPGWLNHNQTVVGAQSSYPALWTAAPVSWKSGSDLVIPNLADTAFIGAGTIAALGATAGVNTATLTSANLPAHAHSIDHDHGSVTSGGESAHTHTINHDHAAQLTSEADIVRATGGGDAKLYSQTNNPGIIGYGPYNTSQATVDLPNFTGSSGAGTSHTHSVDLPNFTGSSGNGPGTATSFSIVGKSLGVNVQIKAH
jgi:microcystin-dependent protein